MNRSRLLSNCPQTDPARSLRALAFAVVVLGAGVIALSCGTLTAEGRLAGLYVSENDSSQFLKLENDGTWTTVWNIGGTWELKGDELLLITPVGLERYKIEGTRLVRQANTVANVSTLAVGIGADVWIKQ